GLNSIEQQQITGPLGVNDTIQFDPGLNGQTITLTIGELAITRSVAIVGPGAGQLTVSGNHTSGVFDITAGTVSLSRLTIANGVAVGSGGGIVNQGNLTVTNCTLLGNSGLIGGGIYNAGGTVTVTNSTLSDNTATFGGGIRNEGNLTVTN